MRIDQTANFYLYTLARFRITQRSVPYSLCSLTTRVIYILYALIQWKFSTNKIDFKPIGERLFDTA